MPAARGQRSSFPGAFRLLLLFLAALFGAGCATSGPDRDFRKAAAREPDRAAWIAQVPRVSGFRAHGELAPVAAVLKFWGRPLRPGALAAPGEDPADLPASEEALVRAIGRQGLWAYPCSASEARLQDWLRRGLPVLARLEDPSSGKAGDVLVLGYSETDGAMLTDGLPGGRASLPAREFLSRWRAMDHRALLMCPPDKPRRDLSPEELVSRGRYYEAAGQAVLALEDYEAARAAGASSPAMLVSLGNLCRDLDRTAEAEAFYRQAIREDPRQARAYNNLAYLLADENRDLEEAARLARQALILDPANPLFMDTLGFALMSQGQYAEAANVLERAWGRSRWYPTRVQLEIGLRLALAHFRGGQEHLAAEVLRDLLSMDPAMPVPAELRPLVPGSSRR